jgi:voltage-gated potassium channel Kch
LKKIFRCFQKKMTLSRVRNSGFVVILALGVIGFESGRPDGQFWDSLYRSIQLFAISFERPPGFSAAIPLTLELARILAPVLLIVTVIASFSERFSYWCRLLLQLIRHRRRYVLLGFGEINQALAHQLDSDDYVVTAVDRNFDDAARAFAHDHGVLLLTGDASDRETLERACVGGATKIIVACGSDTKNLDVATLAADVAEEWMSRLNGHGTAKPALTRGHACFPDGRELIHVHIASPSRMAALNNRRDTALRKRGGFQAFSINVEAAQQLIRRARALERARDLDQSRPHLVIAGLGDLGEAVLIEAMLQIVDPKAPPIITLMDRDIDEAMARLRALYPRLFDGTLPEEAQPILRPVKQDALCLNASAMTDGAEERLATATAWIFACPQDEVNLTAALHLEAAMERLQWRPAPIYARVRSRSSYLQQGEDAAPALLTDTFGDCRSTLDSSHLLNGIFNERAQAIHIAYGYDKSAAILKDCDPKAFAMHWAALPENVKRSNRAVARHLPEKLVALGFDWRGRLDGTLPRIPADHPLRAALESDDPFAAPGNGLQEAACTEHARWMVERAISGWGGAETKAQRSNRRQLHNDIRPFAKVAHANRILDLTALKVALDISAPGAPEARMRCVQTLELSALIDTAPFAPNPGATQLVIRVPADGRVLSPEEQDHAAINLTSWAQAPALVRVQVRIEGTEKIDLYRSVLRDGRSETEIDPYRGLGQWIAELGTAFSTDIIFDVAYLP